MKYTVLLYFLFLSIAVQSQSRTEQALLKLFKEKFEYMNPNNLDKLSALLDDRLVYIHSGGNTESKSELLQDIKAGKWIIRSVDTRDVKIRVYKNNFALITAKGIFHVTANGVNEDPDLYFTEVWTHVKNGWLLASRHSLKL